LTLVYILQHFNCFICLGEVSHQNLSEEQACHIYSITKMKMLVEHCKKYTVKCRIPTLPSPSRTELCWLPKMSVLL